MKKYFPLLTFTFLAFFTLSLPSCQKAPINGNLDGKWEVMTVDPEPSVILIPQRLFYNFQLHVCALNSYEGGFTDGSMTYDGETLRIEFPYVESETDYQILAQYGIYTNPVTFQVSFQGKDYLTLTSPESVVTLRKF